MQNPKRNISMSSRSSIVRFKAISTDMEQDNEN
jgi:hypothetical protein